MPLKTSYQNNYDQILSRHKSKDRTECSSTPLFTQFQSPNHYKLLLKREEDILPPPEQFSDDIKDILIAEIPTLIYCT